MFSYDSIIDGKWIDEYHIDIICERCKKIMIRKFQPFHWQNVLRRRGRKGRLLFYCDNKCMNKHEGRLTER